MKSDVPVCQLRVEMPAEQTSGYTVSEVFDGLGVGNVPRQIHYRGKISQSMFKLHYSTVYLCLFLQVASPITNMAHKTLSKKES